MRGIEGTYSVLRDSGLAAGSLSGCVRILSMMPNSSASAGLMNLSRSMAASESGKTENGVNWTTGEEREREG